jgi:methyl-accepting chemotaxis protein
VGEPKLFGDDISGRRTTVVSANKTGQQIVGVEMGPSALAIYAMTPIMENGRSLAVADVGVSFGKEFVERIKKRFDVDLAVRFFDGSNFKTLATTFGNDNFVTTDELTSVVAGATLRRDGRLDGHPVALYLGQIKNYAGQPVAVIEVVKDTTAFEAAATAGEHFFIYVIAGIFVFAIVLAGLLGRSISRPLGTMTRALNELGSGNFDVALPGLERGDELGAMARSIVQFKVKAAERLRDEAAGEDEKRRVAEDVKRRALQEMANTVERETHAAVGEVSAGTERMAGNAVQMSATAVLLGRNSSSVAAAAEEALANARSVAASSTHLSASISEIASQVASSKELTSDAVSATANAQNTIARLSDAATRVGTVTNLINEIAAQTNLLALNATIEAARAGEAGRGFAVVASEVKSLAAQTAKATSEIALQIAEIQGTTRDSVDAISSIGEVIRKVETFAVSIAGAINEQSAVTLEIARAVEETSLAAREVASQISTVSSEAIETGRRALEIRDGSAEIAGKVDELRAALVRIVRTSTSDVDRRAVARVDLQRPGSLQVGGSSHVVVVRNLSDTGAMIDAIDADIAAGHRVTLRIDGLDPKLAAVVVRRDAQGIFVKFEIVETVRQSVLSLLRRHENSAAA